MYFTSDFHKIPFHKNQQRQNHFLPTLGRAILFGWACEVHRLFLFYLHFRKNLEGFFSTTKNFLDFCKKLENFKFTVLIISIFLQVIIKTELSFSVPQLLTYNLCNKKKDTIQAALLLRQEETISVYHTIIFSSPLQVTGLPMDTVLISPLMKPFITSSQALTCFHRLPFFIFFVNWSGLELFVFFWSNTN